MRGLAAGRRLALAGAALVAGASLDVIAAPPGDSNIPNRTSLPTDETQHLAVVVPAYQGDLDRAVASLERWPTNCSPLTVEHVDLVLYYAEGEEDRSAVEEAAGAIASTAGRCFANLRIVYAHLEKEEDAYPKGPSVMFFKMFLDEDIRSQLSEYDALAIVEWDVLVATDRSFEELYHAAFRVNEEFWVKGSNLEGTNLHSSAEVSEMWRVLGHINGNAIYNNNDPAFVEYVEYTRARWEYKYPYDVALWLTISDFPYSWPLYQRYSSKFVITNLISYVGYEHVTHDTVSDAIAGQTLFIHGSRVDDGSGASIKSAAAAKKSKKAEAKTKRRQRRWRRLSGDDEPACRAACGNKESRSGLPDGTSTVCDPTCGGDDARFDGFLCGAGNSELFGNVCRLCYVCPVAARKAQQALGAADKRNVIMCDTMEPPTPEAMVAGCGDKCADRKDTVCDDSCGSNHLGDYDCNWKGLGAKCRHCYDDLEAALMADDVAKRHGGRVIMCSTMEPPQTQAFAGGWPAERVTVDDASKSSSKRRLKGANSTTTPVEGLRRFFRWSDDGKLSKKETSKWQAKPKWTKLTEWMAADSSEEAETDEDTASTCHDECETMDDGIMRYGRICDESCEDGYPYGDRGCNTSEGMYGAYCRSCYYYAEEALVNDSKSDRAIMCGTKMPVDVYTTEPVDRDPVDSADSPEDSAESVDSVDTPEDEPTDCDVEACPYANDDVTKGRACDDSCESGDPYGTLGCSAASGAYGPNCRACFYDVELALEKDTPEDRAIMCDTLKPVDIYSVPPVDGDSPDDALSDSVDSPTPTPPVDGDSVDSVDSPDDTSSDSVDSPTPTPPVDGDSPDDTSSDSVDSPTPTPPVDGDSPDDTSRDTPDSVDSPDDASSDSVDSPTPTPPVDGDSPDSVDSPDEVLCDVTGCPYANDAVTKGRVCDDSCESGDPYGTLGCSAASGAYGPNCRACFYDVELALEKDTPEDRAIMCDTLKPVDIYAVPPVDGDSPDDTSRDTPDSVDSPDDASSDSVDSPAPTPPVDGDSVDSVDSPDDTSSDDDLCDSECPYTNSAFTKGRVCDDSCESGEPYGTLGCGAKSGAYGPNCRTCFYDVELARESDTPEHRAIMCDTMKPVDIYTTTDRDEPPIPDLDCEETCPYESSDGTGRVCDASCQDGEPYGTYGCNTSDGDYGPDCRFCYFDEEKAKKATSTDSPVIMCDTLMPPGAYSSRRLTDTLDLSTFSSPAKRTKTSKKSKSERMFEEAAGRTFEGDVTRGDLCAFVAGRADEVDEWTVTVRSIQKFAPGMRVAVAAEADAVAEYERALGRYPGVKVSSTASALTASLYADKYCGADDTSLIMYLNRGSVFSRSFTSKDTHSPRGELLVVHGNARASYRDSQLAKHTAFLLGSDAPTAPPSFTYGTDLMLPVGANGDLREQLMSVDADEMKAAMDSLEDLDDLTAVPQVLAALQYFRETEGIWFLDPQSWVSQNLFKEASIWDIPLVKPRFTCAISPTILRQRDDVDVAEVLENSLDFFSRGGKCPNGQIDVKLDARRT